MFCKSDWQNFIRFFNLWNQVATSVLHNKCFARKFFRVCRCISFQVCFAFTVCQASIFPVDVSAVVRAFFDDNRTFIAEYHSVIGCTFRLLSRHSLLDGRCFSFFAVLSMRRADFWTCSLTRQQHKARNRRQRNTQKVFHRIHASIIPQDKNIFIVASYAIFRLA